VPIASFAGKVFQVNSDRTYTFSDFQYSAGLQTEKQDAEGKKPSTYNKGADLDSMNFKIKLDVSLGVNPRREWEEWQSIMNSAVAYPFILGNKPIGNNKWLLVSVNPGNFVIDNNGNILSMELSLQFDEYVRPGSAQASKQKMSSPGLSESEYEALLSDILGSPDKANLKRDNPNMRIYSGLR
jgi:hypothetical protein